MTGFQRLEWRAYGIALHHVVGRGPIRCTSEGNRRKLKRFSFRHHLERLRLLAAARREIRAAERAEHLAWCAWQDAGGHTNTVKWVDYEDAAWKAAELRRAISRG